MAHVTKQQTKQHDPTVNNSIRKAMKPLVRCEERRLAVEESYGNLTTAVTTTRTRGEGHCRPDLINMIKKKKMLLIDLDSSDSDGSDVSGGESSDEETNEELTPPKPVGKPTHS